VILPISASQVARITVVIHGCQVHIFLKGVFPLSQGSKINKLLLTLGNFLPREYKCSGTKAHCCLQCQTNSTNDAFFVFSFHFKPVAQVSIAKTQYAVTNSNVYWPTKYMLCGSHTDTVKYILLEFRKVEEDNCPFINEENETQEAKQFAQTSL
jgi:hypothetical protein